MNRERCPTDVEVVVTVVCEVEVALSVRSISRNLVKRKQTTFYANNFIFLNFIRSADTLNKTESIYKQKKNKNDIFNVCTIPGVRPRSTKSGVSRVEIVDYFAKKKNKNVLLM